MMQMLYQFGDNFASLVLGAMGLAIIFGMMGIINLAHGEFMMIGAMVNVVLCSTYKLPFVLSVIISAVITGIIGFIIDRLIICHLYRRVLDSVVATWGISIIIKQVVSLWAQNAYGNQVPGVSTPFGVILIGNLALSIYRLLLMMLAVIIVIVIYCIFNYTKFGLRSRATMQNSAVAASLGVNTNRIYALTFALGSFLAGLAGALFSPLITISANFGTNYMMPSFLTVLVGGANPLIGTVLSGLTLGGVQSFIANVTNALFGQIGMLVFAIIFIRFFPKGFSSMVERIIQKIASKKI